VSDTQASGAIAQTAAGTAPAAPARGNLGLAIGAGVVAALIGAVLWAVITVTTEYQIGFMAIGVGVLVGFAVRQFGKGTTQPFGIAGAALSLAGCMVGNLFSIFGFISAQESMAVTEVASTVLGEPGMTMALMRESFSPMDLLFYGIAVYEGYKIAMKPTAPAAAAA